MPPAIWIKRCKIFKNTSVENDRLSRLKDKPFRRGVFGDLIIAAVNVNAADVWIHFPS